MNHNLNRVVSLVNRLKDEKQDQASSLYLDGMTSTEAALVAAGDYGKALCLALYAEAEKLDKLNAEFNSEPTVAGLRFVLIEDANFGAVWVGMAGDELQALFVRGLDLVEYLPQSTLDAFEAQALAAMFSDAVGQLDDALIDGQIGRITYAQQLRQLKEAA